MKGYSDYMNKITVDAALHEKIMGRAARKTKPQARSGTVFRYAGMAACAAVLVLSVMTVPGLLHRPDDNSLVLPGSSQSEAAQPEATVPEEPLDALTLNQIGSRLGASIVIPGHFWQPLTTEQEKAVFPELSFPLSAVVHYRGDGSIFSVAAYESLDDGGSKTFDGLYTLTEIVLAPGEVVEDVIYEFEPTTSDVHGVPVVAGVFDFEKNDGVALYLASFKLGDIAYNIKLHDNDSGESGLNRLTELVNAIVDKGEPDLSVLSDPVIPELRDESLTLEEARNDPDFGAYLPAGVPSTFGFDSAQRFINQESDSLSAFWYTAAYDEIGWVISAPTEYDLAHVVSADEREKYDLSLYPIPRAESVPGELREYVDSPVFRAEELSLAVIEARAEQSAEPGDPGWRVSFSVLYDGALVSVHSKGASPEQVWDMVAGIQ